MGFCIIIDGPNLINDLHANGKDINYILETFSLHRIHDIIQQNLNSRGLVGHPFIHTYFVCSDKPIMGEFKGEDKKRLLEKLRSEQGVTVDEIAQKHKRGQEFQVDMSVFIRMLEMGPLAIPYNDPWRHVVLISSDSDFVPAIRLLSRMGTHTVVVGFRNLGRKKYPEELINESYMFIEMSEVLAEMENRPRV